MFSSFGLEKAGLNIASRGYSRLNIKKGLSVVAGKPAADRGGA